VYSPEPGVVLPDSAAGSVPVGGYVEALRWKNGAHFSAGENGAELLRLLMAKGLNPSRGSRSRTSIAEPWKEVARVAAIVLLVLHCAT